MHFYLFCVGGSEVERILLSVGSVRLSSSCQKLHLSPLVHCPFCFPLIAFSSSSFNTTLTPAIRNHCLCFSSLISGVRVSQSEFLIYDSLHRRFSIFDSRASISSDEFHDVIQFQYVFELIRLTYPQFVETIQDVIKWVVIDNSISSDLVANS